MRLLVLKQFYFLVIKVINITLLPFSAQYEPNYVTTLRTPEKYNKYVCGVKGADQSYVISKFIELTYC